MNQMKSMIIATSLICAASHALAATESLDQTLRGRRLPAGSAARSEKALHAGLSELAGLSRLLCVRGLRAFVDGLRQLAAATLSAGIGHAAASGWNDRHRHAVRFRCIGAPGWPLCSSFYLPPVVSVETRIATD